MSHTHDIDNEENLFHFDPCDQSDLLAPVAGPPHNSLEHSPQMPSPSGLSTSGETVASDVQAVGKGKGVTKPLAIRASPTSAHNLFDMADSASASGSHPALLLTPLTPSSFHQYSSFYEDIRSPEIYDTATAEANLESLGGSSWKGKEKERPPVLPPLVFPPTELDYRPSSPSPLRSPSPGPSSYGSSYVPPLHRVSSHPEPQSDYTGSPPSLPNPDTRVPPPLQRRRSLSSLPVRSDQFIPARSMKQIKSKLAPSQMPSNLTRKLLFRKSPEPGIPDLVKAKTIDDGEIPDAFTTGLKVDELDMTIPRFSSLRLQDMNSRPNILHFNATPLRHKPRSSSSPFPLSALDIVHIPPADIFAPFPLLVRNYFDEFLPRELRLLVFEALIGLHEADYARAIDTGRWSVGKASSSKNKWISRDRGFRELVKLSRVSKSWMALAFDGQLWADLDLRSFPNIPESLVLRLTSIGGQHTKVLDLSGHSRISAQKFLDMADHFCVNASPEIDSLCYTQLTVINLQGCSSLTTRSLHHLLVRSRSLQKLSVKALAAVTNTTCDILATYCPQLTSLDVSRCINLDASGIRNMATATIDRGEHLLLKELRVGGLKNVDDRTMGVLGRATPFLEVLDLSYMRQLHNSAIEAFVACEDDLAEEGTDTILVSPRDIGRESDEFRIRRRVTRLRHLSLAYCLLLTDDVCSNLAHSVPHLEFLELGGIGADMNDGGLVRLLNTTPHIRRVDLEDALHITDAVLAALTPSSSTRPDAKAPQEPGHALEYLNISFASEVTDEALFRLIRRCKRLRELEVDNTRVSGEVLKDFVRQCRKRDVKDAKMTVVDCRGVTESTVRDLAGSTRPRMGWRAYEARKLVYLDARDENEDEMKIGQDECDEKRVVVKSFYSWQTVDAVKSAREKRRKASRRGSGIDVEDAGGRALRWWSPGARRSPSPLNIADTEGCTIM
ncbi:hypothetical protein H0H81_004533 [Sphagnurus paluster]|uniref:F-box domain-containing protein n=1 Tax=Sphagnurus paluster TaxID=117069 RepID=A0A9P7KJF0_9AGAR|nr:hypothetical protein H0H81_004533 [Sphagnurus paluster]